MACWCQCRCHAQLRYPRWQLLLESRWHVRLASACSAYNQWVRYPIEWMFECMLAYTAKKVSLAYRQNSMNRLGWLIAYRLVVTLWVPCFATFETLASFSMSIWISCLDLLLGTVQIAAPRRQNQSILGSDEDVWGFGQLAPLILLIQPFSVVWEHLMVARSAKEQQREHEEDITAVAHKENLTSTATENSGLTTPKPSLQDSDVELQRPPPTLLQHLADCRPLKLSERSNHDPTSIEQILTRPCIFHIIIFFDAAGNPHRHSCHVQNGRPDAGDFWSF